MAVATVTFRRCLVNPSGSDAAGRVFFDLTIGERAFVDVSADVTREARTEHALLCVTSPRGYDGPLPLPVFQRLVEFYYLQIVGKSWGGAGSEGLGLGLNDWVIEGEMVVQVEVEGEGAE